MHRSERGDGIEFNSSTLSEQNDRGILNCVPARKQSKTTPGPIGWAGVPPSAAGPATNKKKELFAPLSNLCLLEAFIIT